MIPPDSQDPISEDNVTLINNMAFKDVTIPAGFVVPKDFLPDGGTKKVDPAAFETAQLVSGFKVKD